MCSAAVPTRVSLDLLPDTSIRATSDGLQAHVCRGSSGETSLLPASLLCFPAAVRTFLHIQEHPSLSRDTAAGHIPILDSSHPSSISHLCVPSSSEMLMVSCQTQRAQSHRAMKGCLTTWQRISLPRRHRKEPAWFRELIIIKRKCNELKCNRKRVSGC